MINCKPPVDSAMCASFSCAALAVESRVSGGRWPSGDHLPARRVYFPTPPVRSRPHRGLWGPWECA